MKILIKALLPHRQKILTADGEEMRLQQWANKQAASSLRDAGGDAQGEQFSQSRDMLMRDAVENPEKHGLKFMGERLPFEGQNLQESLSDPMDSPEFKEDMTEDEAYALAEKLDSFPSSKEMSDGLRRTQSEIFDEQGKLRDDIPDDPKVDDGDPKVQRWQAGKSPEEEFNPDAEAEHMRRIMTSRQVPMRDAWSVLKNDFFNPPQVPCAKCGKQTEPMMYYGSNQMGPQDNTLCEECEDNTMMEDQ